MFDTLARCFAGGDENLAKDANQAIGTLDKIRNNTGACILVVHHSGKNNKTERGSSALRAAADIMMLVERNHKTITVSVDKQKEAEPAAPVFLKLVSCGESCVLQTTTDEKPVSGGHLLGGKQRTLLQALNTPAKPHYHKKNLMESQLSGTTFQRVRDDLTKMPAIVKGDGRSGKYDITDLGSNLLVP